MRWSLVIAWLASFGAVHPAAADMLEAARAYERGDYERAVEEWLPHAALGNPDALFNLGQLYRKGLGVEKNLARAEQYYFRAARRGQVSAQSNLGTMLFFRKPDPDREKALRWWQAAASAADAYAQYMLGVVHINGEFVPRDPVKGYAWLTLSAAAGLAEAADARRAIRDSLEIETRLAAESMALEINPGADLSVLDPGPEAVPVADPVAASVPASPVLSETSPGYLIQLAALGSEAAALDLWGRLVDRNADLLGDLAPSVETVERGAGNAVLYRIRGGPFPDAGAARSRCDALRLRDLDCIVVGGQN